MTSPTMTPVIETPTRAPETAADRFGAALALVERGFAVFPLRPGSKVPAVRGDWEGLAVADPERLREVGWPVGGNIGIACGPSGLFVLDLDVAKGSGSGVGPRTGSGAGSGARAGDAGFERSGGSTGGPGAGIDEAADGAAVLRELAAGRPIPDTFTVATPSGGMHLYFRAPAAPRLRNTVARLGPLIDTRATGGYVVGPGSVIRGRPYEIVADVPIAPVPRWIVRELIAKARAELPAMPPAPVGRPGVAGSRPNGAAAAAYGAAALRNEVERVLAARVGTRNDTLNRAAYALGRLVGAGILDRDLAASELFHAARRVGLSARETSSTLASGLGAGIARPRYPARSRPIVSAARTVAASGRSGAGGAEGEGNGSRSQDIGSAAGDGEVSGRPSRGSGLRSAAGDGARQSASGGERERPLRPKVVSFGSEAVSALRAVDRAYDAAALCAAPLVFSRDWRRIRALVDALRDLRDAPRPALADARRAVSLCEAVSGLAAALARNFPAPGRRRARSPLGNALRELNRAAGAAIDAIGREVGGAGVVVAGDGAVGTAA